MPRKPLAEADRQRAPRLDDDEVFNTLQEWLTGKGYSPSIRELWALLPAASSPAVVQRSLERLREAGRVDWERGQFRTLRIPESA